MKYDFQNSRRTLITACAIPALAAIFASPAEAVEPSFNCNGQLNSTESTICRSDRLSQLDNEASAAYQEFRRAVGADAARQVARNMLAKRNSCSSDANCIEARILETIDAFQNGNASSASYSDNHGRNAFNALTEAQRRAIQTRLQQILFYEGEIDGLWGSGTARAMDRLAQSGIREASSLRTREEANSAFRFVLSDVFHTIEFNEECDEECEQQSAEFANLRRLEREAAAKDATKKADELSASCRETAFTLKGLCLALSKDDIVHVLKARGYFLKNQGAFSWDYQNEDEAVIYVFDDKITFSCEVFDVCGQSYGEVAQALVDNTSLRDMEYEQDLSNFGGTSSILKTSYCSIAETGEKVCVSDSEIIGIGMGGSSPDSASISIERHRLGKGEISFD